MNEKRLIQLIEEHGSWRCGRSELFISDFEFSYCKWGQNEFLDIITEEPDGKEFQLRLEEGGIKVGEDLYLKQGAWIYSVCKAFQYLERLDYFKKEEIRLKEKREYDKVNTYFLEKNKNG